MEVMLLDDVNGLGTKGASVRVADGYARNYLLPRKLAIVVSPKAAQVYQEVERQRALRDKLALKTAEEEAKRLNAAQVTISVQANEEDTLFGSITNADIAAALERAGQPADKHRIELEEHIKKLGVYDVPVRLHAGVAASVKVWVVRS
jgi:large subunit ribosomal protein L9